MHPCGPEYAPFMRTEIIDPETGRHQLLQETGSTAWRTGNNMNMLCHHRLYTDMSLYLYVLPPLE
jgi:hypothetical protein